MTRSIVMEQLYTLQTSLWLLSNGILFRPFKYMSFIKQANYQASLCNLRYWPIWREENKRI